MLLIIHNLPSNTRYTDVKGLIKDKCGLTEVIIDNLSGEGKHKKVTVGLADEGDAAILVRKINGLYVGNQQLYVEDVRQKRNIEQPYRPRALSTQHGQEPFNPSPFPVNTPAFDNQFYGQPDAMQYQSFMPTESQIPGPNELNFGVPFYMTAQNQSVGNDHQFMVQYPKLQAPGVNEPYEGRDRGFDQQYGGRQRDQSGSPNRGPYEQHSPKRSTWNVPDDSRMDNRSGRDRPSHRDEYRDSNSYQDKPYRESFKGMSNQDYGSNKQSNRFEKPFNRSNEPKRPDRSSFREQNEPYRSNDNRKFNAQDRRNQGGEPQRFRENNYSRSQGVDYESRPSDFSKKRPYESTDKNKFVSPNKKFVSNKQQIFNQQGASGSPYNYQNTKYSYVKSAAPAPMQSKGQQKAKAPWKPYNQNQACNKPTQEMIAKDEEWRHQAASLIAIKILKQLHKPRKNKKDPIRNALRSCVRARIDVIMGDTVSLSLKDTIHKYRKSFQDDFVFYDMVCEKVARGEVDELESESKDKDDVAAKKKQEGKPKHGDGKASAETPSTSTNRLPKYPAGDKKVLKQMKQAQKDEMLDDSVFNLDPEHEKALKEEFDKIEELIKQQLENPEDEAEKSMSKFMNDVFVPDLRKILSLHVRKRILDVRTSLSVRVICHSKVPNKDLMHAFLKDFGVISLRPSVKNRNFLIAICDSFEHFDALCNKRSTLIDGFKISFKPLHLFGPPTKDTLPKKQTKKQINAAKKLAAQMNKKNDNIVKKDESNNDDGNKEMTSKVINDDKNTIDVQANEEKEDSECKNISLNKSEDVIVIEDNLKGKDVIVLDHNDENVDNDDKNVDLDETLKIDEVEEAIDNEEPSVIKESEPLDGNKATVTGDNDILDQDVSDIIDDDKIAEDDLEDF